MPLACAILLATATMAAAVEVPTLKMNNGGEIPAFGLGTYLGFGEGGALKSQNKEVRDAVTKAFDLGYRLFDTASIYHTEAEVGEAVRMKIADDKVEREEFFITTKLWNTHHKREQVAEALKTSLKQLGLDYIDLYLMHWPIGLYENYTYSDVDFMETWKGMEDVLNQGLTRSIGLSNFNMDQLKRVLREGTVKPVALQIEVHPQITQNELVDFAQSQGIVVMGYSPFGSLVSRYGMVLPGPHVDDPVLMEIANKYGKTSPQVVLRWMVERKIVPIPKSVNPKRLADNINIFDFSLNDEEMAKVNEFNSNTRYTLPSFWQTHPYYPFQKIDNPVANPFVVNEE